MCVLVCLFAWLFVQMVGCWLWLVRWLVGSLALSLIGWFLCSPVQRLGGVNTLDVDMTKVAEYIALLIPGGINL